MKIFSFVLFHLKYRPQTSTGILRRRMPGILCSKITSTFIPTTHVEESTSLHPTMKCWSCTTEIVFHAESSLETHFITPTSNGIQSGYSFSTEKVSSYCTSDPTPSKTIADYGTNRQGVTSI